MRFFSHMSDSLRDRCIEIGAATIWHRLPRYELSYPECERVARTALDAALGYLAENVDEWQRLPMLFGNDRVTQHQLRALINVLRES